MFPSAATRDSAARHRADTSYTLWIPSMLRQYGHRADSHLRSLRTVCTKASVAARDDDMAPHPLHADDAALIWLHICIPTPAHLAPCLSMALLCLALCSAEACRRIHCTERKAAGRTTTRRSRPPEAHCKDICAFSVEECERRMYRFFRLTMRWLALGGITDIDERRTVVAFDVFAPPASALLASRHFQLRRLCDGPRCLAQRPDDSLR